MDNQNLTPTMQELIAQMAAMRAELNNLKERTNVIIPSEQQVKPGVSTNRRKALRRLAGGILAGLGVAGVVAALPEQAEARFVAANGAGAIVVPPGATVSGSISSYAFGLIGTPDSNLALSSLSFVGKAGIVGITSSTAPFTYGVFGSGGSTGVSGTGGTGGTGVSGTGRYGVTGNGTLNGVRGDSTTDGNISGVYGNSTQGNGVYGNSFSGSGVYGNSTNDVGVRGISTNSLGVYGTGKYGVTGDSGQVGVVGLSGLGSVLGNLPYAPIFIAEKIKERKFKIGGGLSGQEISWQVTGIRQDAWAKVNRIPVEEDKTEAEKGKYLHPEVFGKSDELKIH